MVQVRVEIDPGTASPRHTHPGEEIRHVLERSLECDVEGRPTVTLKPGDVLFIPAGTIHGYRIATPFARFTVITTPEGASDFFHELDAETEGSVADMDKIMAVATKHGLTVPPPR